nr:MAG TPA: hypothetical protein [Caudoviricetes sp.]
MSSIIINIFYIYFILYICYYVHIIKLSEEMPYEVKYKK